MHCLAGNYASYHITGQSIVPKRKTRSGMVLVYLVEAIIVFCGRDIQKSNEPRYIQYKYKSEGASMDN